MTRTRLDPDRLCRTGRALYLAAKVAGDRDRPPRQRQRLLGNFSAHVRIACAYCHRAYADTFDTRGRET